MGQKASSGGGRKWRQGSQAFGAGGRGSVQGECCLSGSGGTCFQLGCSTVLGVAQQVARGKGGQRQGRKHPERLAGKQGGDIRHTEHTPGIDGVPHLLPPSPLSQAWSGQVRNSVTK